MTERDEFDSKRVSRRVLLAAAGVAIGGAIAEKIVQTKDASPIENATEPDIPEEQIIFHVGGFRRRLGP